jgi:hypothetical protein
MGPDPADGHRDGAERAEHDQHRERAGGERMPAGRPGWHFVPKSPLAPIGHLPDDAGSRAALPARRRIARCLSRAPDGPPNAVAP